MNKKCNQCWSKAVIGTTNELSKREVQRSDEKKRKRKVSKSPAIFPLGLTSEKVSSIASPRSALIFGNARDDRGTSTVNNKSKLTIVGAMCVEYERVCVSRVNHARALIANWESWEGERPGLSSRNACIRRVHIMACLISVQRYTQTINRPVLYQCNSVALSRSRSNNFSCSDLLRNCRFL